MMSSKISNIKECEIDSEGVFKYIQIQINCNLTNEKIIVIRGWKKYDYHKENYGCFKHAESKNLKNCKTYVLGGGRISINSLNKRLIVYGYSKSYGICDHSLTCKLLKTQFPEFECSWNNESY